MQSNLSNILPCDGVVHYYGKIFSEEKSYDYLKKMLRNISWKNDEMMMFGKKIITKRKIAWYGDKPFSYKYSGSEKLALSWTNELKELKTFTEKLSGEKFNSCLLNLYHNGEENLGWHSDDEAMLKKNGAVASLSFGAERKFVFKHKITSEKVELFLEHGSLMLMKDTTQTHWLHRLPPSKKITEPRVNLTFRTIVE